MVFTELPPGLITIDDAALKYGQKVSTLHTRVERGHLTKKGRLRSPARGGGKVVIDEEELKILLANPPRVGRPRKEIA